MRLHQYQEAKRDQRGFTLPELLVGLAILGITLAASMPGIRSMFDGYSHSSSVSLVTGRIGLARQMAVRDKVNYRITLDTTNRMMTLLRDDDGDGVFEGGERVLGPYEMGLDINLVNVDWDDDQLTFFPNGSASQSGEIQVTSNRGRSKTVRVSSITGNVEVLP